VLACPSRGAGRAGCVPSSKEAELPHELGRHVGAPAPPWSRGSEPLAVVSGELLASVGRLPSRTTACRVGHGGARLLGGPCRAAGVAGATTSSKNAAGITGPRSAFQRRSNARLHASGSTCTIVSPWRCMSSSASALRRFTSASMSWPDRLRLGKPLQFRRLRTTGAVTRRVGDPGTDGSPVTGTAEARCGRWLCTAPFPQARPTHGEWPLDEEGALVLGNRRELVGPHLRSSVSIRGTQVARREARSGWANGCGRRPTHGPAPPTLVRYRWGPAGCSF